MRGVVAAFVLVGCGFRVGAEPIDGPVVSGADPDATDATDGAIDAPSPASCIDRWHADTIRFNAPTALSTANTASYERDPYLSPDELTLYVSSGRGGGLGGEDVWTATRASLTDTFGTASVASAFSTTADDSKVSISSDGLIAVVGSSQAGGPGGLEVWSTTRTTTGMAFPALTLAQTTTFSTTADDHDPFLSANGLRLYAAPSAPVAQHIVVSARDDTSVGFPAGQTITQLDSGAGDGDPTLTPNERIIVFYSNRTLTGASRGNLWYATRGSATGTFGTPRPVPDLNTDAAEGDPHISADGCRLYFARDLGAGSSWDVFVASAQQLQP